jgi:hypothetical protein
MVGAAHDMGSSFVGRERELESLATGLRDAQAGRTRFFLLTGEAGIGKTRTVEELVRRASWPSARVLWGRAPEHAGAPSYWPWIRALEQYADGLADGVLREQLGPMPPRSCSSFPPSARGARSRGRCPIRATPRHASGCSRP